MKSSILVPLATARGSVPLGYDAGVRLFKQSLSDRNSFAPFDSTLRLCAKTNSKFHAKARSKWGGAKKKWLCLEIICRYPTLC